MSRARERRAIEHIRELEEHQAPFTLDELPELQHPGARLCIDTWYDDTRVYILWETPETDEEWAARLAKLDLQAAKRAARADNRKKAAEKRKQEQEAADRAVFDAFRAKYGW